MQERTDRNEWGLPGGCQELGEDLRMTAVREAYEETGLLLNPEGLELIDTLSGEKRKNNYPNGDVVINNTPLYYIKKYSGELKCSEESKEMKFFNLNNLPQNQHDPDLVKRYIKWKNIR